MSLSKEALEELWGCARATWPGRSGDFHEEVVQEALRLALERGGTTSGSSLLNLAKAALTEVGSAERDRQRRGGALGEAAELDEGADGEALLPVRRTKRRPHLPRGVVRVQDHAGARVIPVETADVPDAEVILAVRRLADEVLNPVLRFEPLTPERRSALLEAYKSCFDGSPRGAWAGVLTQEIQTARRAILGAQEAAASRDDPMPVSSIVTFTKRTDGHAMYPGLPSKFAINVRRELLWTDGVRATMGLVGELDGETRILSSEVGTFGDLPALSPNATAQTEAPLVLLRAIGRCVQLGFSPPLPEYVVDPELLAWLIERVGFDGGGGVRGRLSGASVEQLLLDPVGLADEVESYGRRHVERLNDDDARQAERAYGALAARIRVLAQVKDRQGVETRSSGAGD